MPWSPDLLLLLTSWVPAGRWLRQNWGFWPELQVSGVIWLPPLLVGPKAGS